MGEVLNFRGKLDERLVTYDEFAEMMRVSLSTVNRWRAEGMPVESDAWAMRIVRIRPSEARRWLETRKAAE